MLYCTGEYLREDDDVKSAETSMETALYSCTAVTAIMTNAVARPTTICGLLLYIIYLTRINREGILIDDHLRTHASL